MGLGICWLHLADLPPSKVFIHYSILNVVGPHIKVLVTYKPKCKNDGHLSRIVLLRVLSEFMEYIFSTLMAKYVKNFSYTFMLFTKKMI